MDFLKYNVTVRLVHLYRNGRWIAGPIEAAETPLERMRGLLGRDGLEGSSGMMFSGCSLVHTWFMRFPIDVVFLSREGRILKLCEGLKPFRMAGSWSAAGVLEMGAGMARLLGLEVGQVLSFEGEAPAGAPAGAAGGEGSMEKAAR